MLNFFIPFDLASHTTSLGVGPDVMNNWSAPANCVGGSEQGCVPVNCGPHCAGSVSLPKPMSWYPANTEHTTALGVGPNVMNNWAAPNNCVGGSEQGCVPANCGYQCGGEAVTVPKPMTWYPANAEHTTALGVGPNVMNNWAAPNNCVGGSEQGCVPANCGYQCGGEAVTVPKPMTWYSANGEHTTALCEGGPKVFNCMECPNNCVGGSEQGCPIPDAGTVPKPMSWYPANGTEGMQTTHQLAVPVHGLETVAEEVPKVTRPNPGHAISLSHAFVLAAVQGVFKGDFSEFNKDVEANAEAVNPYGAFILRNHVFAEAK